MSRWLLPLCALLLSSAGVARAEWREADSGPFILYSQSSEADVRQTASDLARFDHMLRRELKLPAASPVDLKIYLMSDQAAIQRALGEEDDSGIAGFYAVSPRGAIAIGMQESTGDTEFDLSRRDIMFHEYVHHLMAQHSDAAYPLWYAEGFAEYYAMTEFLADGAIETGRAAPHRIAVLKEDMWMPIRQLLAARGSADLDGEEVSFYAQSWLLVHYLTNQPARRDQLERYLLAVNSGVASETAAASTFGDLDELDRELRDYARRPWLASRQIGNTETFLAAPVGLRLLDEAEAEVLPYEAALGRGVAPHQRKNFARQAREIAARHPDSVDALALLTAAELQIGNRKRAAKAVDRWVALRPHEPRALMYKAMVGFAVLVAKRTDDPSRWNEARQWLERARRLAPRDPMVMDMYYDSFTVQGINPTPDATDALIRATQLVPQFDELRLKLASDYERRNHLEAAIMTVKPVVFRSEGPGAAMDEDGRAKQMLVRLQRKLASEPRRLAATMRGGPSHRSN